MIQGIFSLLSVFPISFFLYSWTEREVAKHESRVGKNITFSGFVWQTWIDTLLEARRRKWRWLWLVFLFQCALPFLSAFDFEFIIFPWIVMSGYLLTATVSGHEGVLDRVDSDHRQTAFSISSAIALLCLTGSFVLSHSANLNELLWSPLQLLFVLPFQIAGMILFQEHPFRGFLERSSWLESVRFYGWCMVTAQVFLGGGEYFVDSNLKSGLLFFGSRLLAIYTPRFRQNDLLRVATVYLLPVTGGILLVVLLLHALISGGTQSV